MCCSDSSQWWVGSLSTDFEIYRQCTMYWENFKIKISRKNGEIWMFQPNCKQVEKEWQLILLSIVITQCLNH